MATSSRPSAITPIANELGKINFMLYGEPGVGKSVLAGSGENTLILANDSDETVSAAMTGSSADMWVCSNYDELDQAYEYLRLKPHGYKWVWFDNGSLFQEQGMDQIMEDLVKRKPHRDRFIPDMHEYLENQNRLGLWVRQMKALPFNFGITAHVMRREDPDDGSVTLLPLFQGGRGEFSSKICGYMNVVAYMTRIKKGEGYQSKIVTNKTSRYYAKDRFGVIGTMIDPTIPKIEAAIGAKAAKPVAKKAATRRRTKAA